MKQLLFFTAFFALMFQAFADDGLDCSKNIVCKKVVKGSYQFMVCSDGTTSSMCFLASPASGANYFCDCDISCKFPDNNLDSDQYTCSRN